VGRKNGTAPCSQGENPILRESDGHSGSVRRGRKEVKFSGYVLPTRMAAQRGGVRVSQPQGAICYFHPYGGDFRVHVSRRWSHLFGRLRFSRSPFVVMAFLTPVFYFGDACAFAWPRSFVSSTRRFYGGRLGSAPLGQAWPFSSPIQRSRNRAFSSLIGRMSSLP